MRRAALNPFFSQKTILGYSPSIQKRIDRLCERIKTEYAGQNRPLNLVDAWSCLTTDVIIDYCFERDYHFMEKPNFRSDFAKAIEDLMDGVHVVSQFPWLPKFFQTLPDSVVIAMQPGMKTVLDFNNVRNPHSLSSWYAVLTNDPQQLLAQAQEVVKNKGAARTKDHKTVFNGLLESGLPPAETEPLRLQHEAISLVGAGIDTTKRALYVACFHILDNPPILARLQAELNDAIPDPGNIPSLPELQRLPFLSACIEESKSPPSPTSASNGLDALVC